MIEPAVMSAVNQVSIDRLAFVCYTSLAHTRTPTKIQICETGGTAKMSPCSTESSRPIKSSRLTIRG